MIILETAVILNRRKLREQRIPERRSHFQVIVVQRGKACS
jgi:hypothetical protein